MKPKLNLTISHHAVQSSSNGTVYVQNGYAFDEGKNLIGEAPAWGPSLFRDKDSGQPVSSYEAIVKHAKANPFVEVPELVSVDPLDGTEEEPKPLFRRGPGRPRKNPDGSGYGSGST